MRFADITGQEEIKQKLIRTVIEQRVSHAQLFYGPEGCGKLELAIAYAQFINCTNRQGMSSVSEKNIPIPGPHPASSIPEPGPAFPFPLHADSCGVCPSCQKYQKLIHPDLHFIYPVAITKKVTKKPQSKLFLAEWRNFLIGNHYKASLQGWYQAIEIENRQGIINADDCNEIITTLGYKSYESDYKVMIIWMPEKIYISAAPKILKILEEPPDKTLFILVSEDPDQIIRTILSRTLMVRIPKASSAGSVRIEEDANYFGQFRTWMRTCYSGKIPEVIGFAGEIARTGRERQKAFLTYGLKTIGHCHSVNNGQEPPGEAGSEEVKFIHDISPFINQGNVLSFYELFNTAIFHIERNAHAPTLFLDLSLKIVRLFKPKLLPL